MSDLIRGRAPKEIAELLRISDEPLYLICAEMLDTQADELNRLRVENERLYKLVLGRTDQAKKLRIENEDLVEKRLRVHGLHDGSMKEQLLAEAADEITRLREAASDTRLLREKIEALRESPDPLWRGQGDEAYNRAIDDVLTLIGECVKEPPTSGEAQER